jgi:hypothetical protein
MGMTLRVRIAFCLLCAFFVLCIVMALSPAKAEPQCADYKAIQAALAEKFHQAPSAAGLAAEGKAAYTIFSTPDGAGWTLVIVGVSGKSCIVAAGQNWVDLSPGKGDPT